MSGPWVANPFRADLDESGVGDIRLRPVDGTDIADVAARRYRPP